MHCPARSPDLTCLSYFLLGYVKIQVYETPVNSAEDLVAHIAAITGDVQDTPGIFTFDLQCAENLRPATRPEVVISNIYFDDYRNLFNVLSVLIYKG